MRLLALFLLLPAAALAQGAVEPLPIVFLPGGAGAEGCFAQWATRSAVRAYSAPTEASQHLRTVDAERRVDANDYSESLTAVLRPGLVRVRGPLQFSARRLGTDRNETVRLGTGAEVEVLAPGPEESVYFAFANGVYAGALPGYYGGAELEVVRRPVTELWVRLVEHGPERPASWLNTAQAGMVPREPFCL